MAKLVQFPCFKAILLHLSLSLLLIAFTTLKCASMEPPSNLTFFMHDITGSSAPSERVVAGTIVNTRQPHTTLPFSKPKNRVFPIPRGTPLLVDNNTPNLNPSSPTSTVISNVGTNNNVVVDNADVLPYVKPGTLPLGATLLDNALFGRITVIDYEVTRGRELESESVIGKAQGFHLASSMDGSSKTMAFTVLFGDEEGDTISLFGVHRTAVSASDIAVVGGTGRYGNAKGYAKLESVNLSANEEENGDGVHKILQTTLYLTTG